MITQRQQRERSLRQVPRCVACGQPVTDVLGDPVTWQPPALCWPCRLRALLGEVG